MGEKRELKAYQGLVSVGPYPRDVSVELKHTATVNITAGGWSFILPPDYLMPIANLAKIAEPELSPSITILTVYVKSLYHSLKGSRDL